ncbi:MAG TPA: hypothetical protein VNM90_21155 [Haliangium sp.]|nr:hypothetical protein [Haliangium sp.]
MPSATHHALVTLLLERPELLTSALAPGGEQPVPASVRIRAAPAVFRALTPSYQADLVLRVEDGRGRLLHLLIGEVQLRRDRRKRISWPIYVTAARAEVGLDCPVTLVVVTLTAAVARWCAQPIALDTRGGSIVPLVLRPEDIPKIVDVETACAHPGLAALSAMAHAHSDEAPEIATAALVACRTLDSQHAAAYADVIRARLDPTERRAMEKLMAGMYDFNGYRLQSSFARSYWAKGHKKGLEKGRKEGQQQVLARMLTVQLEQRFGPLPGYAAKAIETADVGALIEMGSRVFAAASLKDVVKRPARRTRAPHSGTAAGTTPRSRARRPREPHGASAPRPRGPRGPVARAARPAAAAARTAAEPWTPAGSAAAAAGGLTRGRAGHR